MIVKNESKIIRRCIDSCLPVIDAISICDTGSTDNTVEIIEEYLQKYPGKCHRHEWKNFGTNRSLSFDAAVETAKALKYPLKECYGLLMDADMMLCVEPKFNKNAMKDPGYSIIQSNVSISYHNCRFVRMDLPWKCIGVTHEYWGGDGCHYTKIDKDQIWIDDKNDGGCKSDKFERDIRLLEGGLKDEPDNVRYMYYLGQSYKDYGQQDKAIEMFQKRVDAGGWDEEQWYAMLQIARIYKDRKDEPKMLEAYLKAYEKRPHRAETLFELANHYRLQGKNNLAFMFAHQAMKIPYPKGDVLFIADQAHGIGPEIEASITGFYTPFNKTDGLAVCQGLLLKPSTPQPIKELCLRNLYFYMEPVNPKFQKIEILCPPVKGNITEKYRAMNPCVLATETGFIGNVRTVNYTQTAGNYKSLSPDGKVRTRNFFTEFDANMKVLSQREIIDATPRKKIDAHVLCLEDVRVFKFKDDWWCFSNSQEELAGAGPQQMIGKLTLNKEKDQYELLNLVRCTGKMIKPVEKNWLPFIHNDAVFCIYNSAPFMIVKPNLETGEVKQFTSHTNTKYNLSSFRGSGGPIPYEDGFLFVIHEVLPQNWRTYIHRFVFFNKRFQITRVSLPFIYDHRGVEYCISLSQRGDTFYMGVGLEDAEARMYSMTKERVKELFDQNPY